MTVPLEAKLDFLRAPENYPGKIRQVVPIETHMSWVFLAGDHAFKLKKPVHFPLLDFTTLESREHNCREEVRLNRRLAPDVYLGVIPLVLRDGVLALDGKGEVIDWLVKMHRLPADRMLDVRLAGNLVSEADLEPLIGALATLYRKAARSRRHPERHFQCLVEQQRLNRLTLLHPGFSIDHDAILHVLDRVDEGLQRFRMLIEDRIATGRYAEGHGDMRPEHICLADPVVVFDCLEFSRDLRFIDPFDEIAFLGMECAFLDAPWVGDVIWRRLKVELTDPIPEDLLHFYSAFRATMRARLALGHLVYGTPAGLGPWEAKTDRYIRLALDALGQIGPAPPHHPTVTRQQEEKTMSHGHHSFDDAVKEANLWLKVVEKHLHCEEHHAYQALRAALHALRDRLTPESAVQLSAQLPVLIRGVYFDGWSIAGKPVKDRDVQTFCAHVEDQLPKKFPIDGRTVATAVFKALWERLDPGQSVKITDQLPPALRSLWPDEAVQ